MTAHDEFVSLPSDEDVLPDATGAVVFLLANVIDRVIHI